MQKFRTIVLKHLLINKKWMIGMQFSTDKVIQTFIKELPSPRWSKEFNMVYLKNNKSNLKLIFKKFKGIAWIDGSNFFRETTDSVIADNKSVILTINREQFRIFIKAPAIKKPEWLDKLRSFDQSYYIKKYDIWAVKGGNDNYLAVKKYFESEGCNVIVKIKNQNANSKDNPQKKWYHNRPIDLVVLQEYKKTLTIKRASDNTKRVYISMFKRFLAYFSGKAINSLTTNNITDYMLWEIEQNNISATFQNQLINAIKYYYEKTLGHSRTVYSLPRAKKKKHVPTVLNKSELKQVFSKIDNLKHRCIISLLFSAGIRRNELIKLKPEDIDFVRKIVTIKKGKGDKERISILSDFSIKCLKQYILDYKPKEWLFVGQTGGQYSSSSIWKIFDRLKKQYKIEKKGSVHLLRHTFATSLLESGTDIRYIQNLLGHNSLKTTQVYTHVANHKLIKIKSPMDSLDI